MCRDSLRYEWMLWARCSGKDKSVDAAAWVTHIGVPDRDGAAGAGSSIVTFVSGQAPMGPVDEDKKGVGGSTAMLGGGTTRVKGAGVEAPPPIGRNVPPRKTLEALRDVDGCNLTTEIMLLVAALRKRTFMLGRFNLLGCVKELFRSVG